MAEKPTKIVLPDGRTVDGVEVGVDESTERWSDISLTDGTIIRVKTAVISAIRANNEYDQQGNPMYSLNMAPVIAILEVPDKLRKKGH